jgi:Uma2 family endonuclease
MSLSAAGGQDGDWKEGGMITVEPVKGERLLSLAECEQIPQNGSLTELVRGRVVFMNPPFPYHGFVCGKVDRIVGGDIEANDLGYAMCNDSGIVTERDPDSLRGADFASYCYDKIPRGTLKPRGYLPVVPDLIIEVKSPDDAWKAVLAKVAEYLHAGVFVVCDPEGLSATVCQPNQPEQTVGPENTLSFPQVLPGFSCQVRRFFE